MTEEEFIKALKIEIYSKDLQDQASNLACTKEVEGKLVTQKAVERLSWSRPNSRKCLPCPWMLWEYCNEK